VMNHEDVATHWEMEGHVIPLSGRALVENVYQVQVYAISMTLSSGTIKFDGQGRPALRSSHSAISRDIETVISPMGAKSNEEDGPKLWCFPKPTFGQGLLNENLRGNFWR